MDSELIEEAERGNREIQARDHRALFAAVERERLVSEAATAILASEGIEPQEDGTYWGENTWPNAVKDAATCLAVFEAAQKPADDEREALANLIPLDLLHDAGREGFPRDAFEAADRIIASDVWRSRRLASVSPALGDLENHLGRTSEGTALLPALWALAGVSPEPSVELSVETRYPMPDRDDYETQTDWVTAVVMVQGMRQGWLDAKSEPQTEPTDAVRRNDEFTRLDNYTEEPQTEPTRNPCEFKPQAEPSGIPGQFPTDAQVGSAMHAVQRYYDSQGISAQFESVDYQAMRAALRAAVETANENGSRSDG